MSLFIVDSDADSLSVDESLISTPTVIDHGETLEDLEDLPEQAEEVVEEVIEMIDPIVPKDILPKQIQDIKNSIVQTCCSRKQSLFFVSEKMHWLQQHFASLNEEYRAVKEELLDKIKTTDINLHRLQQVESIINSFFE
jgi:DNA-directed RNA polymerase subunit F